MKTHDQSKSDPELVQISIDGELYYAFKWWDEKELEGRAVRYVVKDSRYDVISYMLIICAHRIPGGTELVSVKFYGVKKPNDVTDYWPAETTWENGDADIESVVRICSPKTTFPEYREVPRDLEQMIREHKTGKRQLHKIEKKATKLEDVLLLGLKNDQNMSSLQGAVANIDKRTANTEKRTEVIHQHVRGVPVLQEDLADARIVPEALALEIQNRIADILTPEEQVLWRAVRNAGGNQKAAFPSLQQLGIVKSLPTLNRRIRNIDEKLRKNGLPPCNASGPTNRCKKIGGYKNAEGKDMPVEFSPVEKDWAKDPSDRDATIQSYLATRSEEDKKYFHQTYPSIEDEAKEYRKRHPVKSR